MRKFRCGHVVRRLAGALLSLCNVLSYQTAVRESCLFTAQNSPPQGTWRGAFRLIPETVKRGKNALFKNDHEIEVERIRRLSGALSAEDQAVIDRYALELEKDLLKQPRPADRRLLSLRAG